MKIEKEKKITFWYILDKNERRNMRKLALSDEILLKIEKPARYIGNEVNSVMKDKNEVDIRFAMCFPDVYEIGMSHLGIQILYDMFNRREDVWCERVYSPWMDLDKIMREKKIPLFALEISGSNHVRQYRRPAENTGKKQKTVKWSAPDCTAASLSTQSAIHFPGRTPSRWMTRFM